MKWRFKGDRSFKAKINYQLSQYGALCLGLVQVQLNVMSLPLPLKIRTLSELTNIVNQKSIQVLQNLLIHTVELCTLTLGVSPYHLILWLLALPPRVEATY